MKEGSITTTDIAQLETSRSLASRSLEVWTRIGPLVDWARSRRGRRILTLVSLAAAAGLLALAARHFGKASWPLAHVNIGLAVAAGFLFLAGHALKAWGWRRLFAAGERPHSLALAAAGGGASVTGVALPGRFDDAVRIAIVRRYPGCPAGAGAVCLSLVLLGLVDAAALAPFAAVAAALPGTSVVMRVGFAVVALAGVAAAVLLLTLPRLAASKRVLRYRLGYWLGARAISRRGAWEAWALVLASWVTRAVALFLLLGALGLGLSIPLAIVFLCAGAASAALPVAPAGAATQAGAGAAILIASGVRASKAIGFAAAAQSLVVLAGAAILLFAIAWQVGRRFAHNRATA